MKIPAAALAVPVLLASFLLACGAERPASEVTDSFPVAETSPAVGTPSDEGVTYEPAYPEEVSSEGLSEEDIAQQEAGHSHEEGAAHEHDHGEEGHSHGDGAGADHDHDH